MKWLSLVSSQTVFLNYLISLEDARMHYKGVISCWSCGVYSNFLLACFQEAIAALEVKETQSPCMPASVCGSSLCPPKTHLLQGRLCLFSLPACSSGASNWVCSRLACDPSLLGKGQVSVGTYLHSFIDKVILIEMKKRKKLAWGVGKNNARVIKFWINILVYWAPSVYKGSQ